MRKTGEPAYRRFVVTEASAPITDYADYQPQEAARRSICIEFAPGALVGHCEVLDLHGSSTAQTHCHSLAGIAAAGAAGGQAAHPHRPAGDAGRDAADGQFAP